jgi:hypothetical protein
LEQKVFGGAVGLVVFGVECEFVLLDHVGGVVHVVHVGRGHLEDREAGVDLGAFILAT